MTYSDEAVTAAAAGSSEAWAQLVDAYADLVWQTAVNCGLDEGEAAAVSEVVWCGLAQVLPRLRTSADVACWLLEASARAIRQSQRASALAASVDVRHESVADNVVRLSDRLLGVRRQPTPIPSV